MNLENNDHQEKKPKKPYKKVKKPSMVDRLKQHLATITPEQFQKEIAEIEEAIGQPKKEPIVENFSKDKLDIIDRIIKSQSFLVIFDDSEIEVDVFEMTPERITRIIEMANQEAQQNKKEL